MFQVVARPVVVCRGRIRIGFVRVLRLHRAKLSRHRGPLYAAGNRDFRAGDAQLFHLGRDFEWLSLRHLWLHAFTSTYSNANKYPKQELNKMWVCFQVSISVRTC